jgi:hypothetical protein
MVASELVTNAVRACDRLRARTDPAIVPVVRLWLVSDRIALVLQVWDGSAEMPLRQQLMPDQESGWGLMLVDSLAEEWGIYPEADGKVVWALIR